MATSKRKKQEVKLSTVDLGDVMSLSQRDRFILNIRYKNQEHTLNAWKVILRKEGFGLKNSQS